MMKFAFFLVVAICAFQGYQARSVAENEITPYSFQDVIEYIVNLVNEGVEKLIKKIKEVIANIDDVFKHFKEQAQEFLKNLMDKIQQIVDKAGKVGKKCLDEQHDAIEQLKEAVEKKINECRAEVDANIEAILKAIKGIKDDSTDIILRAKKCPNAGSISDIVSCFHEQIESVFNMIKRINDTMVDAVKKIDETNQCLRKAASEVYAMEAKIIDGIKECIKANTY